MNSVTPVALTQSMSLFIGLMPGPDALVNTDNDEIRRANVRVRETAAVVMSLGSGLMLAVIAHDAQPFYVALVVSIFLAAAAEFLIRVSPFTTKGQLR